MSKNVSTEISGRAKKDKMSSLSKSYLIAYNCIQTIGWGYILVETLRLLIQNKSPDGIWTACEKNLMFFQTLAALEVLHCVVGLVPSNPFVTFLQVASRVAQVWGILYSVPEVQNTWTVPMVIVAWAVTEIIRYSFYATNLLSIQSKLLTWCRYTFFYGLYPTGVFAEISNIVQSLSYIKKKQLYSFSLPNPANVSFNYYYVWIAVTLSYIPLFPMLFNHMRRQRSKVLGHVKVQ